MDQQHCRTACVCRRKERQAHCTLRSLFPCATCCCALDFAKIPITCRCRRGNSRGGGEPSAVLPDTELRLFSALPAVLFLEPAAVVFLHRWWCTCSPVFCRPPLTALPLSGRDCAGPEGARHGSAPGATAPVRWYGRQQARRPQNGTARGFPGRAKTRDDHAGGAPS